MTYTVLGGTLNPTYSLIQLTCCVCMAGKVGVASTQAAVADCKGDRKE